MELESCSCQAVQLCFATKSEGKIDYREMDSSIEQGKFVWLDILVHDFTTAYSSLLNSKKIHEDILEDAAQQQPTTQCSRYEEQLHVVLADVDFVGDDFVSHRVDVVIAENYLITIRTSEVKFLTSVWKSFSQDFELHARSPSFLLYEFWDHLLDRYVKTQNEFEDRVENVQRKLFQKVGDEFFTDVSELGSDLLEFRKLLLPARAVLSELSNRRSKFISEATQPYLGNMIGSIETVLQDLLVDRDILSESLHLYMSMVGHRTNSVMRKLTVVSVIFLPLTFLVGVYGMNFRSMPELGWDYGYVYFWSTAAFIIVLAVMMMKKNDLL